MYTGVVLMLAGCCTCVPEPPVQVSQSTSGTIGFTYSSALDTEGSSDLAQGLKSAES